MATQGCHLSKKVNLAHNRLHRRPTWVFFLWGWPGLLHCYLLCCICYLRHNTNCFGLQVYSTCKYSNTFLFQLIKCFYFFFLFCHLSIFFFFIVVVFLMSLWLFLRRAHWIASVFEICSTITLPFPCLASCQRAEKNRVRSASLW